MKRRHSRSRGAGCAGGSENFGMAAWYRSIQRLRRKLPSSSPRWLIVFFLFALLFIHWQGSAPPPSPSPSAAPSGERSPAAAPQASPPAPPIELSYRQFDKFVQAHPGPAWFKCAPFFGHSLMTVLFVGEFPAQSSLRPDCPWGHMAGLLQACCSPPPSAGLFPARPAPPVQALTPRGPALTSCVYPNSQLSSALPRRPRRALDRMICGGQLFVCLRSNLFRELRTVLNQQLLDSHFRGILEPRSSVFPEIQDSCHAQSRNNDLASLPVSLHAFRCPLPNLGQYGHNPRAQRLVRNAGNFVDVLALKEIYNLRGESSGRLTVHLRRVNVTKVCVQINLY